MNSGRTRRWMLVCTVILALSAGLGAPDALARGGLRWGYVNQTQGYPILNLWLMTNPWSQMSGWAIPHHSVGAPDLNPGSSPPRNPLDGPWMTQPSIDRSVLFPGSSSQTTVSSAPARTGYIP